MKKILFIAALTLSVVSCDMDKMPYDAIPDTEALVTPSDFANMRVGLYSGMRSSIGGDAFYNSTEIQCDGFHAVVGYSNTLGDMYRWTHTSQASAMSTVYGNYQAIISRANFIIDGYNKCDMSNDMLFTENDKAEIKNIKGEAFFVRAYALYMLSQYFCADYEASTADNLNSGVSYVLNYAPSSSPSTYPARKTLNKTYAQIKNDMDSAAYYITTEGAPSSIRISKDAITALRARVALSMDDYSNAAAYAEQLISTGTYILAAAGTTTPDDGLAELEDLWYNDGGNETILQLAIASLDEIAAATGTRYQPYQPGSVPDYIPTQTLLDLYSGLDYRKYIYFNELTLTTVNGSTGTVLGLNKYLDQGRLWNEFDQQESARFVIEPKVFRIAEMYLIAAEGYAQAGNIDKASEYLNALEASRIYMYPGQAFSTKEGIMAEIQNERQREMVAEGSRLFDMKRWKLDMKRGEPQQADLCLLPGATTTALVKKANDNKFVWPIPKHEIDANPQIVQNPGY